MDTNLENALKRRTKMTPIEQLGAGPCFETWKSISCTGFPALVKVSREPWFQAGDTFSRLSQQLNHLYVAAWHSSINRLVEWWNVEGHLVLWYQELCTDPPFDPSQKPLVAQPPQEVLPWIIDLAGALEYLSRMNLFHGYVKPHHLLESCSRLTLIEGGLFPLRYFLWDRFKVPVSWEYVPPELRLGSEPHPTTDLYCLGLVYLILRTGWLPQPQLSPDFSSAMDLSQAFSSLEKWEAELVLPVLDSSPDSRPSVTPLQWATSLIAGFHETQSAEQPPGKVPGKASEILLEKGPLTSAVLSRLLPGGTLWLTSRLYDLPKPLVICKPLRVCGKKRRPARVVVRCAPAGIEILSPDEVIFQNLQFICDCERPIDIVRARTGKLVIERCSFLGTRADQGLRIVDRAEAVVRNCLFNSHDTGIAVEEHAQARIEQCRCQNNGFAGIVVSGHSHAIVAESDICENGEQGIYIGLHAHAELTNNRAFRNRDSGIAVFDSAKVEIRNNTCYQNQGHGISVTSAETALVFDNTCNQNLQYGIGCYEADEVFLTLNKCLENARGGMILGGLPRVEVRANIISSNRGPGITAATDIVSYDPPVPEPENLGADTFVITSNVCSNNEGAGIWVRKKAQVTCTQNLCHNNQGAGISFSDESGGRVVNNCLKHNHGGSICTEGEARPFLQDNIIEEDIVDDFF